MVLGIEPRASKCKTRVVAVSYISRPLIGLPRRLNEILVNLTVDGVFDLMEFSDVSNIPNTQSGMEYSLNVITNK